VDTDDLDYIQGLLDKGVYIGMDRYGLDIFLPTGKRNATVTALLEKGHADRMVISQDFDIPIAAGLDWYPIEMVEQLEPVAKDWSMTFLFDTVFDQLREAGMTDEQYETIMVENPRRWLEY